MKRFFTLLLLCLFLVGMSGCFASTADELYSLPQLPEQYFRLQALIDGEIAAGSEFAAPTDGSWRQSVQLSDLDGDGRSEALAFFRGADSVLRICIYRSQEEDYVLACTIQGEGSAIGSIEYADLNGDGVSELIVTWQVGSGLRLLEAYSLVNWQPEALLTTDCTDFLVCDLNGDGQSELVSMRFAGAEGGSVSLHSFSGAREAETVSARLSTGLETVGRVRTGYLSDGAPALFVDSSLSGGIQMLTDVFVCREDRLENISMGEQGVSDTVRSQIIYCADIDNDKVMEIPQSSPLPQQSETVYYALDWFTYDAQGQRQADISTYHCYSDGWFMTLPAAWREVLTVRRQDGDSGERAVVFSAQAADTGEITDFLVIYTLTGENRHDRAHQGGRFILREDSTTIYAARILDTDVLDVSQETVKECFGIIFSEWMSGTL